MILYQRKNQLDSNEFDSIGKHNKTNGFRKIFVSPPSLILPQGRKIKLKPRTQIPFLILTLHSRSVKRKAR